MSETAATSKVGVRELRQNLRVYLRRIDQGERFEVTDRGTPVALLIPLPVSLSPLERLVAEGIPPVSSNCRTGFVKLPKALLRLLGIRDRIDRCKCTLVTQH